VVDVQKALAKSPNPQPAVAIPENFVLFEFLPGAWKQKRFGSPRA
jgi:hypothetical protein